MPLNLAEFGKGCDFREFSVPLLHSLDLSVVLASVSVIFLTFLWTGEKKNCGALTSEELARGRGHVYLVLL